MKSATGPYRFGHLNPPKQFLCSSPPKTNRPKVEDENVIRFNVDTPSSAKKIDNSPTLGPRRQEVVNHLSTCVESLGPSETVGSVRAALSPVRTLCVKSFGASAKFMSCSFNSHGMTALFLFTFSSSAIFCQITMKLVTFQLSVVWEKRLNLFTGFLLRTLILNYRSRDL